MGRKIWKLVREKDIGSMGIGAMIVFIAMVLVAGIAASVLIQTSVKLESQAMATGSETTAEVSTGLDVVSVIGHQSSGKIDRIAVIVRPRSGSQDIDLGTTVIEISDSYTKNFLILDTSKYTGRSNVNGDLFNSAFYPTSATKFSIIVLEDADGSCSSGTSAVINAGDYVALGINTDQCFGGISPRGNVWGIVMPEEGSPGVINFKAPPSLTETVIVLQ